jgi:hypothetical protein
MAQAIRLAAEPLRSLAFGSITNAGFTRIQSGGQPTGFLNPIRHIMIQNLTDVTLEYSFDGVNAHFVLPSNAVWDIDITANKTVEAGFFIAQGSSVYVQYIGAGVPTLGAVYVTSLYGAE